jgi:hypothetical protein
MKLGIEPPLSWRNNKGTKKTPGEASKKGVVQE